MAHQTQGLIMHELDAIALFTEKVFDLSFAKHRPIMSTDKVFCILEQQRTRHAVGPLHGIARKGTADGIDIVQAHIAVISTMQQLMFGKIAMHAGRGFAWGKHKFDLDPIDHHHAALRAYHIRRWH